MVDERPRYTLIWGGMIRAFAEGRFSSILCQFAKNSGILRLSISTIAGTDYQIKSELGRDLQIEAYRYLSFSKAIFKYHSSLEDEELFIDYEPRFGTGGTCYIT